MNLLNMSRPMDLKMVIQLIQSEIWETEETEVVGSVVVEKGCTKIADQVHSSIAIQNKAADQAGSI